MAAPFLTAHFIPLPSSCRLLSNPEPNEPTARASRNTQHAPRNLFTPTPHTPSPRHFSLSALTAHDSFPDFSRNFPISRPILSAPPRLRVQSLFSHSCPFVS